MFQKLLLVVILFAVAIVYVFDRAQVQALITGLALNLMPHYHFNWAKWLLAISAVAELATHDDVFFENLEKISV